MQTLIVIGIYFIFSLQICVVLKIRVSVVINLELTFKKAAGDWLTVEVKVCLDFKLEVVIDMEAVLHNFTTNYTYEAVG